jgi:Asp-tRNA(Asn)/Glu-tRNA(Gln) amidotransferase A subunit family amidase
MASVSYSGVHARLAMLIVVIDDIDLVKNMPICIQIVGGRFGEEKAVAVAKVVDGLIHS